jgi:hypothetical protein
MRILFQSPSHDTIGVNWNDDKWADVNEPNRVRLMEQIKSLKDDLGYNIDKSIDKGRIFAYDATLKSLDNKHPMHVVIDSLQKACKEFELKMTYEGNEEQKKYFQGVILGLLKSVDLISKRRFASGKDVSFYDI